MLYSIECKLFAKNEIPITCHPSKVRIDKFNIWRHFSPQLRTKKIRVSTYIVILYNFGGQVIFFAHDSEKSCIFAV